MNSLDPTFSIITPTQGRVTLTRMLESLEPAGAGPHDELVVVIDGDYPEALEILKSVVLPCSLMCQLSFRSARDLGASPRNHGMEIATKDYITYMDDDNIFVPGAFDILRDRCPTTKRRSQLFRVKHWSVGVVWQTKGLLQFGQVDGHGYVLPNDGNWSLWRGGPAGDFNHISETIQMRGQPTWREEVIVELRPGFEG